MDSLLNYAQSLSRLNADSYLPIKGRVAYVVSHGKSYASHGYAIRTQGIASALNQHGFETLCFVRPGRPWEFLKEPAVFLKPEVEIQGVRYIHSRWKKTPNSERTHLDASVERFVELFSTYRPEMVLSGSNWVIGLPAWIAAKQLGLPFYNEVRGFWELSRAAREPGYELTSNYKVEAERDNFVARQAEKIFTLNSTMQKELVKRGIQSENIYLVPNGVSDNIEIKSPDPTLMENLGISENDKVIGYVGSFNTYEGLDTLLDACTKLVQKGMRLKLLLVGDDQPVTDTLVTNKAKVDLMNKVPWLIQVGRVSHDHVSDYFALMDTVVIPRKKLRVCEVVPPMKVVEALAYSKRLVVSNVAPLKEYAEKFDCVDVFEADNSYSLVEVLQNNIGNPIPNITVDLSVASNVVLMAKILSGWVPTKKVPFNFKAISIMDEISEECWKYEFNSFRIDRKNYKRQVENSTATFAFLESCWKGNGGSWEYAFTSPGLKHANAQALLDLIPRIKNKKMPIVFWNKEDPMHYDRYLPIAKQADIIFTTDSNKVADYKKDIPTADVYAVPFAAQQKICNPSDRFRIKPESVCFAGSYYGEGHDERKRQMHALLPSIIDFNGAIYDRFSKLNNDRYKFPTEFQPFIRDAVPFNEVVQLYKKFKVFLNVNTIIDSPTMMSRRVYELLACGTPVVSTPSKAIEEQFSGIVQIASDAKKANIIIEQLLTDEHHWEKISHLGYREVMTKHTYTHRLQSIKLSLGYDAENECPLVSIITCTRRPNMIDRIVENMTRQVHPNCELILVLQDFSSIDKANLISKLKAKKSNIREIKVIQNDCTDITLGERFNHAAEFAKGEFIAKMDDDDFYFKHYLSDMLIPFSFGDYGMVGKKEIYMYLSGSDKLIKRFPGMKHREIDFVAGPTFVIKRDVFQRIKFESRNTGEDSTFIKNLHSAGYKVYSSDPFNFIQFRADPSTHTWAISDEEILNGSQTQVITSGLEGRFVDF